MSNKDILVAVVIEWLKPVIPAFLGNKINQIPALSMFENWVKNTGIAPQGWSIAQDITPLIQGAAYDIIAPIIIPKLDGVNDEIIPQIAHGIVDAAIQNEELQFLGGNLIFKKEDLIELKKYLDCNLPYNPKEEEKYHVIKPDAADGKEEKTAAKI